MIFGKHINRYYIKHAPMLLLGIFALLLVDFFQLEIPEIYRMVIDGMSEGCVVVDGVTHEFTVDFVLDEICRPFIIIIVEYFFVSINSMRIISVYNICT